MESSKTNFPLQSASYSVANTSYKFLETIWGKNEHQFLLVGSPPGPRSCHFSSSHITNLLPEHNFFVSGPPIPPIGRSNLTASFLGGKVTCPPSPQKSPSFSFNLEKMTQIAREAAVDLAAGSAGAMVSVYAGQPLDTVKVKMQTFPAIHRTMLQCFRNTLHKEGIRGLYAGTVPALAANIAENSVLFAAYGMCQRAVALSTGVKGPEELSSLGNAASGFFAAFFSSLTLCPTELVKCRLQAMRELQEITGCSPRSNKSLGPWTVTRYILSTEGVPGLFRGLTATFAREMPGYFFFFGGYEATRTFLTKDGQTKDDIGLLNTFISGGVAGCALWTAMFPTDLIKSRIQVAGDTSPMWRVAVDIYRTEGLMAFYNGLRPTLIRSFPATGLLLVTYEYVKKAMQSPEPA
ncbi:mitochondrial ornithine transporter 1 isoform X2 [Hyalella azteca]|uniref:Mitochondrial ornithine transporter 1 isoform X2 n=1 Tax=Hyalella azteca TaxID=294128 RepID=A0A8B7PCC2_HYAAZ|nr:mitochondrial ornithine transporter 1 isoform X2 [Hyalella azteca]